MLDNDCSFMIYSRGRSAWTPLKFPLSVRELACGSRCVLSEHFSCVLPNDERFPCPINLPSSISFANAGAAVYGTNGKCKLSGCADGYHFNNVRTGCDKDPYIPEDDGAPVHLLNGVCSTSHWVRINARYRTRFVVGDLVSIVTPGGVPSFDPATVSPSRFSLRSPRIRSLLAVSESRQVV